MSQQTIQSLDLSIDKVFDDFYIIPDYQREYVWQEQQIEDLLNDVWYEFSSHSSQSDEYFIGSIVVCSSSDETNNLYELIDGQQRLTTLYIFFCVIKNYIIQLNNNSSIDGIKSRILGTYTNSNGYDDLRYKVIPQCKNSEEVLKKFTQDNFSSEKIKQQNNITKNLIDSYNTINNFIKENFKNSENDIRKFFAYFTKKVKLVRVKTVDVNHALRVFETINNRGVGLDSMDLLKNLIFKQVDSRDFAKINNKWKELKEKIDSVKEKPMSFLRYFILSQYDVDRDRIQSKEYQWLLDNENVCNYKRKPLEFIEKIVNVAEAYVLFRNQKNLDKTDNRHLNNLKYLIPTAKQYNILLLAGMKLSNELFLKLCFQVENLLFIYIVLNKKTIKVGKNTAIDRAATNLKEFQSWNSQSIKERQRILTYLAKKVWDME